MKNNILENIILKIEALTPHILGAIIILVLGLWLIKIIMRISRRIMEKRHIEVSVANFLSKILLWALRIMLFIIVISKLGIPTTSFIAILGTAGLAIGMALQGSLSNFAGGILIIVFKPFKVGDYISAQGISGTVKEISIFTTKISNDTNQLVTLPNGNLSNDKVINYSSLEHRREMLDVTVDYGEDLEHVKNVLMDIINKQEHILKDGQDQPKPALMLRELGAHALVIQMRYWTKTSDFWATRFAILEDIKNRFEEENIKIPYEQKELHITTSTAAEKD